MWDSRIHTRLHILSWILTRLFKKKVTVTGFNRDHYAAHTADGYIDIRFDTLLATEHELFYKVLHIIRQTLAQGRFVVGSVFGYANLEDGGGNYIWSGNTSGPPVKEVTDDNPSFKWSEVSINKLPFEWSCYLPYPLLLRRVKGLDDGSIAYAFLLKYSIAMDRRVCISDEFDCPPENSAHLGQLREDVETLWGKNTQRSYNFYASLQALGPYEIDLYGSGQDLFISASIVRAFKEKKEDLCTDLVESLGIYYRMFGL